MTGLDLVLDRATLPDGRVASIGIGAGRIAAIVSDGGRLEEAEQRRDLDLSLVVPGLVDGHNHLDTTFFSDTWKPHRPCKAGFDVAERIAIQKELLEDALPVGQRAGALVELAVSHGTTHIRTHVEIDVDLGLSHLEGILGVRERYRDAVTIQIVAFPRGVIKVQGTLELLDEALKMGADVVGGLDPAGFDGDVDGHLDAIFGLADHYGVGIDIHLHDRGALGLFELEEIAKRTRSLCMGGRVAVSHAYALGDAARPVLDRAAAELADVGVAIMTNAPGDHPFPPVLLLRQAGVTVFAGNDDIRDSWWPYGDADMLERAMLIGYRSGFYTDEELTVAFEMASYRAADALGITDYGLRVGDHADLVVLGARNIPEVVVTPPKGRDVYKKGRLVAQNGRFCGS